MESRHRSIKPASADGRLRIFSINTECRPTELFWILTPARSGCGLLESWKFSPALDQKLLDIHSFKLYYYHDTRFKKKEDLGRRDARMVTREEHLARCKQGAIARLDAGDVTGAIASMISDLRKSEDPLYDATALRELLVEALVHRTTPDEVRSWINSFN